MVRLHTDWPVPFIHSSGLFWFGSTCRSGCRVTFARFAQHAVYTSSRIPHLLPLPNSYRLYYTAALCCRTRCWLLYARLLPVHIRTVPHIPFCLRAVRWFMPLTRIVAPRYACHIPGCGYPHYTLLSPRHGSVRFMVLTCTVLATHYARPLPLRCTTAAPSPRGLPLYACRRAALP